MATFFDAILADDQSTNDNKPADLNADDNKTTPDPIDDKVIDDAPAADTNDANADANQEEVNYWKQVESILGEQFDVALPSDVTPDSPEAVKLYFNSYKESAVKSFLSEINEATPDVVEYLQYRANGGDPASYFKVNTEFEDIQVNDENTAKIIIRNNLRNKGLDDKVINKILEAGEEEETLIEDARAYVAKDKQEWIANKKQLLKQQEEAKAQYINTRNSMVNELATTVNNGIIGNFIIPKDERNSFVEFVAPSLVLNEENKFYLYKEVSKDNLGQILQEEYFRFKKGDLSKLINNTAKTVNAQNLRLTINKSQSKTNNNGGVTNESKTPLDKFIDALK